MTDVLAPRDRLHGGVAVVVDDVSHSFPSAEGPVVALDHVSFTVAAGEQVGVLGPSGSGKSTLVGLVTGLRRAERGRVFLGADEVSQMSEQALLRVRSERVGVVLQNPAHNLLPYGTALDNVRFAQRSVPRHRRTGLPAAEELLEAVGMSGLAGAAVARLSGGEQQRVAVAVGMASAPGVLVADEPTSQLDAGSREGVVELLRRITHQFGTTLLVVTHDPAVARALGRVVTLDRGRVVASEQHRVQTVIVGDDGSIPVPEDLRHLYPPGTWLRVVRRQGGVEFHLLEEDR